MKMLNLFLMTFLATTAVFAQQYTWNPHTGRKLDLVTQQSREKWLKQLVKNMESGIPGQCQMNRIVEGFDRGQGENYIGPTLNLYLTLNGQEINMNIPQINGTDDKRSGIVEAEMENINGEFHSGMKIWKKIYSNQKMTAWEQMEVLSSDNKEDKLIAVEMLTVYVSASGKIGTLKFAKYSVEGRRQASTPIFEQICK